jgi:hypothetical protein
MNIAQARQTIVSRNDANGLNTFLRNSVLGADGVPGVVHLPVIC